MNIKIYFSLLVLLVILLLPAMVFAQDEQKDFAFRAKVVEILEERDFELENGEISEQQSLLLQATSGKLKGEEIVFDGIGNFDVVKKDLYEVGDRVQVVANFDDQGNVSYFVTDYVRSSAITWLFVLFVIVMILVGRFKGLRAIVSLVLSFVVIVYYIIPQILDGADPIIVTIIGSLAILLVVIYITEGFDKKSHIASLSIFISLVLTIILAWLFVGLAKLSGLGSEEISFLVSLDSAEINFRGLLLAGIIIGTLGVLDDVIISQIATVGELYENNNNLSKKDAYFSAYKVGVSHISSMANTLFLAYAGASLPLLILFVSGQAAFTTFADVINNEVLATEIVRTLAGSIGLILAVPISTWLAVIFLKSSR